jgi:hypothetical protein
MRKRTCARTGNWIVSIAYAPAVGQIGCFRRQNSVGMALSREFLAQNGLSKPTTGAQVVDIVDPTPRVCARMSKIRRISCAPATTNSAKLGFSLATSSSGEHWHVPWGMPTTARKDLPLSRKGSHGPSAPRNTDESPELLRVKGELLLLQGRSQRCGDGRGSLPASARLGAPARRAVLGTARRHELAQLLRDQARAADALALRQPVYDRFSEGFDTADLKPAKALIDSLTQRAGARRDEVALTRLNSQGGRFAGGNCRQKAIPTLFLPSETADLPDRRLVSD